MLRLWQEGQEEEDQKTSPIYRECILNGSTCQLLYADIQSFSMKVWRRSRTGLISKKILGRRSRRFWSLLKRRDNFGVSSWCEQRGDGSDWSLHRCFNHPKREATTSHSKESAIYMSIPYKHTPKNYWYHKHTPSNCWYCGVELYYFKDHFKKVFDYSGNHLDIIEETCPIPKGAKELVLDHFVPRSKNGGNEVWNLVPCCTFCNSSKGNKDIEEFRQYRVRQTGIETFKFWAESCSGKGIALLLAERKRYELRIALKEQIRLINGIVEQYRKKEQKINILKSDLQSLEQAIARGEYGASSVCEGEA